MNQIYASNLIRNIQESQDPTAPLDQLGPESRHLCASIIQNLGGDARPLQHMTLSAALGYILLHYIASGKLD